MTREWQPGDVALVNDTTRPTAPWEVAICTASAISGECETRWRISSGEVWSSVSQVRPLVVIDPEDAEQVERLSELYREQQYVSLGQEPMSLPGYRMQAALREFANPTPPRPEEPTGLGAVVEDDEGQRWIRFDEERTHCWFPSVGAGAALAYDDLAAVRVLSEGVPSDA